MAHFIKLWRASAGSLDQWFVTKSEAEKCAAVYPDSRVQPFFFPTAKQSICDVLNDIAGVA